MTLKFLYRQMFAMFFFLSFSIIMILDVARGRNVLDELALILAISFAYGILGVAVNALLNLIFSDTKTMNNNI